jgi:hypothetical protein
MIVITPIKNPYKKSNYQVQVYGRYFGWQRTLAKAIEAGMRYKYQIDGAEK